MDDKQNIATPRVEDIAQDATLKDISALEPSQGEDNSQFDSDYKQDINTDDISADATNNFHNNATDTKQLGHVPPPPPPPNNAYQYSQKPPKKPIRRVGTFTMGIALIGFGLAICYSLLNPGFDYFLIVKLSPLVLVLLGAEIVLFSTFSKNTRIRYDFLSGFVCFLIICGSLIAAAIPTVYKAYGYGRVQRQNDIETAIVKQYESKLTPSYDIALDVYLNDGWMLSYIFGGMDRPVDTEEYLYYANLNVTVNKKFKTPEEFADYCLSILNSAKDVGRLVQSISFRQFDENREYSVYVYRPYNSQTTVNRLMPNVIEHNLTDQSTTEIIEDDTTQQDNEPEDDSPKG